MFHYVSTVMAIKLWKYKINHDKLLVEWWLKEILSKCKNELYLFFHSNSLGNIICIWKQCFTSFYKHQQCYAFITRNVLVFMATSLNWCMKGPGVLNVTREILCRCFLLSVSKAISPACYWYVHHPKHLFRTTK